MRVAGTGNHQRTQDQLAEDVDYCVVVDRGIARDGGRRLQREPTGEGRNTPQHRALFLGEQIEAPIERRAKRLLSRQRGAAAIGEQPEAVIDPRMNLLERERANSRSRKLERQRNSVEMNTELRDDWSARRCQGKPRLMPLRPFDEKAHGIRALGRFRVPGRIRKRQRIEQISPLSVYLQWFPAGRDDREPRGVSQQREDQRGADRQQVLAVVENQHQLAPLQKSAQCIDERLTGVLAHAQDLRYLGRNQRRIEQRAEVDEPHAIAIGVDEIGASLQRQTRLADPADTDERQQSTLGEQSLDVRQLALAADG